MILRIIFSLLISPLLVSAQCLDNYRNLIPDQTPSYPENFGNSVALYGDVMAVGASYSDSLGYKAGIVYLYQKTNGTWRRFGVLRPSIVTEQAHFGTTVKMTADYILVGCNFGKPGVYIYRRPSTGWTTGTETVYLNNGTNFFGGYFDLSPDQQTLAISDVSNGAVYVYHKQISEEWNTGIAPQFISAAESPPDAYLLGTDVHFINDHSFAYTTNPFVDPNKYNIYIFSDHTSGYTNFQWEAKLTDNYTGSSFGSSIESNSEGIFRYQNGNIIFYKMPSSGIWQNAIPDCIIPVSTINGIEIDPFYVNYKVSTNSIDFVAQLTDKSTSVFRLTKSGATWCDGVINTVIFSESMPPAGATQVSVVAFDSNGSNTLVYARTFTEDTPLNAVGIGILSMDNNNQWTRQVLAKGIFDASDANFGRRLWQQGNYLFVSSINEKSGGDEIGSVYVYKKENNSWLFVNKLREDPTNSDDEGFGASITGSGNTIAVAAYRYKPGKIFLYEGMNGNFDNPTLAQELKIPDANYDTYSMMAMNSQWLVIPVSSGSENTLLFYKKDISSEEWIFSYDSLIGNSNPFFKQTPYVDMDEHILAVGVGGQSVIIMELNSAKEKWIVKSTLKASDPDQDEFILDPSWPVIRMDGSYFGFSVKIADNKIFVTSPGKNNGGTDVGAVYLYVRQPGQPWKSGTETKKILPDNPIAHGYFGISLDVYGNTLAVSAIQSGAPGKVLVFQTHDYLWSDVAQVIQLNGTTSTNDHFGAVISISENDFVTSAYSETNAAGTAAGTVYLSKFSSMLQLIPPLCDNMSAINLTASPSGGTWSGPGVLNSTTGTFNPSITGIGTHLVIYKVPGCTYENKVRVEVKPGINAITNDLQEQYLCSLGKTKTMLSVQNDETLHYQWSFREDKTADFVALRDTLYQKEATSDEPGQYAVELSNAYCSTRLVFDIHLEELDVEINPFNTICDSTQTVVNLKSNYPGGIWSIDNNSQNLINPVTNTLNVTQLSNGTYITRYNYTSENQCQYNNSQQLEINRLPVITLKRQGSLCLSGSVTISTQDLGNDIHFIWMREDKDSIVAENNSDTYVTSSNGIYSVRVENQAGCQAKASPILIDDTITSKIFVPNVFTPNSDGRNETFKITFDSASPTKLLIINRYGKTVFEDDGTKEWDGSHSPPGVYYWQLNYTGCDKHEQQLKGFVELIK
jgi:gliding motility-associated-like protein